MKKFDVIQNWLDNVAYSHSGSERTRSKYRWAIDIFCDFIEKPAQEILEEYEEMTDREFKRRYARYLRALIGQLSSQGYASTTVTGIARATKSFFKYNDLPLGYVPGGTDRVTYHNRDISREEIISILRVSRPREKAFFCMMAQSGLRPATMCSLQLKNIQPDFEQGIAPCKIDVPQEIAKGKYRSYFSFMGEESVKYLKAYLSSRSGVGSEDLLFTSHGSSKPLPSGSVSHVFRRIVNTLKENDVMEFKRIEGKPATVRLYNLRKFFRKYANQAGFEFVQFWMGHTVTEGSDEHYRPVDVEFHRKLYAEKAMPFLRLETETPSETHKVIEELRAENRDLRRQIQLRDAEQQQLVQRVKSLEEIIESEGWLKEFHRNFEKHKENIRRALLQEGE